MSDVDPAVLKAADAVGAWSSTRSISEAWLRSAAMAMISPPVSADSLTADSARASSRRAQMATLAPSRARTRAHAAPNPRLEPPTNATFPAIP
jgi:hypothetical protein